MIDILAASSDVLREAGFLTSSTSLNDSVVLTFEDTTVLGFLIVYRGPV
jgi:hypothetical protein